MRVISPVSLPTYLSVVYRNNMSAVPASIHLKTNVDRIYLLLLKTVLSFPSLLSKTMSIFQDFFKTFLQFSQIQDYFQDLNEFINFKTFSSLEENVRTMMYLLKCIIRKFRYGKRIFIIVLQTATTTHGKLVRPVNHCFTYKMN